MKKDDFLSKITEIGVCTDDSLRRTMLTELSDEIIKDFDEFELNKNTINDLNEKITKNNEDMETLRQANMKMFLRLGKEKDEKEVQEDSTGIKDPESNKEKLKFEDLFKEENKGKE